MADSLTPSPAPHREIAPGEYWCETSAARLRAHVWHEDRPGRPILFLNGVGASLEVVAPYAEQFPERRFVAIEMPGSGLTPPTDLPLSPPVLARLMIEAAEGLGVHRFDLTGLSLGGALAQQIALQYRGQVERLVLAGTCSGFTMLPHDWSEESLMRTLNPFAAVFDDLLHDLGGPHMRHQVHPAASSVASQFASFAGWSSLAFLPLITAPTLVLAGARDRIVPPANALQLSAFIPRADHYILPDAGHVFPFTEPERTASHVRRFYEKTATPDDVAA